MCCYVKPASTFGTDFHIDLPECGAPGDLLSRQKADRQRFQLCRRRRITSELLKVSRGLGQRRATRGRAEDRLGLVARFHLDKIRGQQQVLLGLLNPQQPFPLPPLTFWDSPASAHGGKAKGSAGHGSLDRARKGFCTCAKGNKCSKEQQGRGEP
ncbi:hypothetical protein Anapl_08486 [Anas platyrhynchos]|uniref:Uncharacterized protein n=1 Tax=Anas platyrhynchos TaxID=8839 RepID=R0LBS2_ANAPL|nr:hypothetical protein Anapl_08486 [Anas platyrhynchos]